MEKNDLRIYLQAIATESRTLSMNVGRVLLNFWLICLAVYRSEFDATK